MLISNMSTEASLAAWPIVHPHGMVIAAASLAVRTRMSDFKLCIIVYRCLHGLNNSQRLMSEIHSRQRLRSASSTDVVVPATRRSSLGDRAFLVAGARAWNALPPSVIFASSLSSFR